MSERLPDIANGIALRQRIARILRSCCSGFCMLIVALPFVTPQVALAQKTLHAVAPLLEPFSAFQRCMTGVGGGIDPECDAFDYDFDFDVDADDYALFWCALTGRSVTVDTDLDGVIDCSDRCPNDPSTSRGPCGSMIATLIIRSEPSGFEQTEGYELPPSDTVFLENECFVAELWVMDVTNPRPDPEGVWCAFIDLSMGDFTCPLGSVFRGIRYGSLFPDLHTGEVINDPQPATISEFGACARDPGVGRNHWALLASVLIDAPDNACHSTVEIHHAPRAARLFGSLEEVHLERRGGGRVDFLEQGSIYDLDGDQWIGASDFSLFSICWGKTAAGTCAASDFDCDGLVGPNDFSFFSAAWDRYVYDPTIIIPHCQTDCPALDYGEDPNEDP